MLKKYFQNLVVNKYALLVILLGSICWSLTMVKSGAYGKYGLSFWGPNGHDGIWHIALAESLSNGTWRMPVFAGSDIKNYHLGFDLILAALHRVSGIPILNLYFQILPPILALTIGFLAYFFVIRWTKSIYAAVWSLFFIYFGGSFGWVMTLIRSGVLQGESLFWSQQAISTLINPPFALSLVFIFAGLLVLQQGLITKDRGFLTAASVLFGLLVQIKVYAGVLILAGLLVAGIYQIFRRDGFLLFKVFAGSLIISVIIFSPLLGSAGSSINFKPFWFLESMMQLSDRLSWQKFGEAMMNYKTGQIWHKYFLSYLTAFGIFILGNFGLRIIGIFYYVKKIIKHSSFDYFDTLFLTVILFGIAAPTLFVQSGSPWNTIQFLYYSLVFSGVLAGIQIGKPFRSRSNHDGSIELHFGGGVNKRILLALIVLVTLPTTIGTLWFDYLPPRPPAKVSQAELDGLNFLRSEPSGTVLTYPFDRYKAKESESNPPRPLYLYESTAYVSAFTGKTVFLEDEVNMDITGYPWKARRSEIEKWYTEADQGKAREFLKTNSIKYIYWIKGEDDSKSQRAFLGDSQLGLKNIFENKEVIVYKVLDQNDII